MRAGDHKEVKEMNKYELAVVVNGQLEDSDKNAVVEKAKDLITRFGGTITSVDDWGKKKYAYEVKKTKEGYYLFVKFQAEPSAPAEIEKRLRIMENVYRYLIVSDEKELSVKSSEAVKADVPAEAEEAPAEAAAEETV